MTSKGCVLDLRLDDESGTSAHDYSRYGNDGALNGCKWVENGLEFNGSSDYVDCGNDASLKPKREVTMSFWMKLMSYPINNVAQTMGFKYYKGYSLWPYVSAGGFVNWLVSIKSALNQLDISHDFFPLDTWVFAAFVYTDTSITAYRNGSYFDGISFVSTGDFTYTDNFYIGDKTNALIDEARIYNRALSAAEIYDYYESTKHRYK